MTAAAQLPPATVPQAVKAHAVRLQAVISAAQRLAQDIEDEMSAEGFDLATALQCVLKEADSLADGLEASLIGDGA